jgi:hypothetical protein
MSASVLPGAIKQAELLYKDAAIEKLAHARRLSTGEKIDYVLVYKLPKIVRIVSRRIGYIVT